ncbi:unnamed protein product [Durusdinium trenchii]|uniref:Uncharacterized protein n=1 Tax=Durusdinium trenchii TaxID=1381693 RepID=A0ABP0RIL2_9DINO
MALRLSIFRAMAKAAPKPKTSSRPSSAKVQSTAPAVQPPPPAAPGPSYDYSQAHQSSGGGGGIMYQILLGMGSMFGVIIAINLVSRLLGPRKITVIHKDSEGRQEGQTRHGCSLFQFAVTAC